MSSKLANWAGILFLLAIMVLCVLGFNWRSEQLILDASHKLLDARFWYSPTDVRNFFEYINPKLDGRGLKIFALTQVTIDFIFPIAYGTFFVTLITLLYSKEVSEKLIIIPLLATIFDLGENFILAYLAANYVGKISSPLAQLAGIFTSLKWIMTVGSVLLLLAGLAGAVHRYVRGFRI
jgi:hypothetical protein